MLWAKINPDTSESSTLHSMFFSEQREFERYQKPFQKLTGARTHTDTQRGTKMYYKNSASAITTEPVGAMKGPKE